VHLRALARRDGRALSATVTAAETLEAVRELAPSIRERAAELEAARQLPADLYEELKAAGAWRFLTPRSHGGLEAGLLPAIELLETLAVADGSTAWTTMIGIESPQLLALLPRESFDELYADGPDVTIGGAITPVGRASPEEGGYRVSGRWPFASGCERWDLLMGTCIVFDGEEPRTRSSSSSRFRIRPASSSAGSHGSRAWCNGSPLDGWPCSRASRSQS
jgi:alkylation response protein AidB-like acyl-CoA dehydrogenase